MKRKVKKRRVLKFQPGERTVEEVRHMWLKDLPEDWRPRGLQDENDRMRQAIHLAMDYCKLEGDWTMRWSLLEEILIRGIGGIVR